MDKQNQNVASMEISQFLATALSLAKKFTDSFISEVKLAKDDYKGTNTYQKRQNVDQNVRVKDRYGYNSRYIFQTHRSQKAKITRYTPQMVYAKKGKNDDPKKQLIEAMDAYLVDKLQLHEFYRKLVHAGLLHGHVSAHQAYQVITSGTEVVKDEQGNPMMDENGQPITKPITTYDDPVVMVDNPVKTYFAPGSEYSEDCRLVPFIVREKSINVDEIEDMYGIQLEADQIPAAGGGEVSKEETMAIGAKLVYEFVGKVPKSVGGQYSGKLMRILFTKDKNILFAEESEKYCTQAKLYGDDDSSEDFFGFGLAYILRDIQKEMSISKSQIVRIRDQYAYIKPLVRDDEKIDSRAIFGTTGNEVVRFTQTAPSFLTPPNVPPAIFSADQMFESEGQSRSGSMDLSKGAQNSNTVKTATGQQIFADSMEVLVEDAKKIFGKCYRATLINVFKLCQKNWPKDKVLEIEDEDEGTTSAFLVNQELLQSIDFDKDVDVRLEDNSYNKDIRRRDVLNMYSTMSTSEVINKEELAKFTLKEAFGVKDPEKYIMAKVEQMPLPPDQPTSELPTKGDQSQSFDQSTYGGPYANFPTGPRQ